MNQFLIFGRPRSRTAWIANFLTVPNQSFCHHEAMADAQNPIELKGRMDETQEVPTGNADTGMIHTPREILRFFPDAKLVMLTGASFSWHRFAAEKRIDSQIVQKVDEDYADTMDLLEDRGDVAFVDVHMLIRNEYAAQTLWAHCTGDMGTFDMQRYHMLRDLNVQVVQESLEARIASRIPRM